MLRRLKPEIGQWYENQEDDTLFEVVSIDEDDNSIGIQFYDGEITLLELETFARMSLLLVEQPEDWSAPFELDEEDRYESDFMGSEFEPPMYLDDYDSNNMQIMDDF